MERRYKDELTQEPIALRHGNYGNFLYRERLFEEAERSYSAAYKAGGRDAGHLGNYALLLENQRKIAEATKIFEEALKSNPKHSINLGNFANLKLREGLAQEAEKLYQRALDSDVKNDSHHRAGYAATLKVLGRTKEAMEQYRQALAANSTVHAVHLDNYAVLLGKSGRTQEAESYYLRAIALAPKYAGTYYNMACLKAMAKLSEDSIGWLRQAIGLGYRDVKHAMEDDDLQLLRTTHKAEFEQLLATMKSKSSK